MYTSLLFLIINLLIICEFSNSSNTAVTSKMSHLIVLCHGLNGDFRELSYLERKINELSPDCIVLNSKENNGELSKLGIEKCAINLATEIKHEVTKHPNLKRISLVGMSLGGLIQR